MEEISNVVMFSTENLCAKCSVLKQKLEQKGLGFTLVKDTKLIRQLGFLSVPVLYNGKEYLDFKQAVEWVNNIQEDK